MQEISKLKNWQLIKQLRKKQLNYQEQNLNSNGEEPKVMFLIENKKQVKNISLIIYIK